MSRQVYPHSRSSIVEYATVENMMERVDGIGNAWYNTPADDLYLRDFVFFTRMQTARRMTDRYRRFPKRDKVLNRLMEEGTFDRRDPDYPNTQEQFAMAYSASMVQRLLVRIEHLESEVGCPLSLLCRVTDTWTDWPSERGIQQNGAEGPWSGGSHRPVV